MFEPLTNLCDTVSNNIFNEIRQLVTAIHLFSDNKETIKFIWRKIALVSWYGQLRISQDRKLSDIR